jgi:hypothetical protein
MALRLDVHFHQDIEGEIVRRRVCAHGGRQKQEERRQ